MTTQRTLSDIMNNEALEYAMYTVESRAIPSLIDGLKPVQRFVLYSTIKNAPREFKKVAAIAGMVSDYGYHHGEVSAQDSLKLMAAEWTNNLPIISGEGNFGSRMVQESAAARYVFAKLHSNFSLVFKDLDLSPVHADPEHIPPRFYVPSIPIVLCNGVQGIATGFATNILPHCPQWVANATKEAITKGKITSQPLIKFPQFTGTVLNEDSKYTQVGTISTTGLTVTITEIPTDYDYPTYIAILDSLLDKGVITSWSDQTKDTFKFIVRMSRGTNMSHDNLIKILKLSKSYTQNINVLNEHGKLMKFDCVQDLILHFVNFKKQFIKSRIQAGIKRAKAELETARAKKEFIIGVNSGKIDIKGMNRNEAINFIKAAWPEVNPQQLLSLTVDKMTTDEVKRLEDEYNEQLSKCKYWETTTPEQELLSDINDLKGIK